MSARRATQLVAAVALVLCTWAGPLSKPARAAHVVHAPEGQFVGADAPGGPFQYVFGVAVDNSGEAQDGDVYVGEVTENPEGELKSTVFRFDQNGAYDGIAFTGADTPAGSFSFIEQESFLLSFDALAVDNSAGPHAGDVYVADADHGAVDVFDDAGHYLCQITGSAIPSASECNGATGSATPAGETTPSAIALDEANGDLYVADAKAKVIDKFDSTGKYIDQIADPRIGEPSAIDLDSSGDLYVVNGALFNSEGRVIEFDPSGAFVAELESNGPLSLAVDRRTDHVYVGGSFGNPGITEYDAAGSRIEEFGIGEEVFYGSLAVDADSGRIYGGNFSVTSSVDLFSPDTLVPDVSGNHAVPVDDTTVHLDGNVDPAGAGDVTSCNFEYGPTTSYGHLLPCDQTLPITGPATVTATLNGLAPSTTYHFRLAAGNAGVSPYVKGVSNHTSDATFSTTGPPTVDEETTNNLDRTAAELRAKINPHGYATQYRFQYVDDAHFTSEGFASSATRSTAISDLGDGTIALSVGQSVGGLTVGTTYHYRTIATNVRGTVEGAEQTFATLPVAAIGNQWAYAHFDSATVEAKINPLGLETICQVQIVDKVAFERSAYAEARTVPCPKSLGSGSQVQTPRVDLASLNAGTEYHFRFVVTNQSGTEAGADQAFFTFGITSFSIEDVDSEGHPYTQAGGYPFETISHYEFTHTQLPSDFGTQGSLDSFIKELFTEQPPGRIGYTTGAPRCLGYVVDEELCSGDSQVGIIKTEFLEGTGRNSVRRAQYNVITPQGVASRYASVDPYTFSDAHIRTGGDYGTTGGAFNLTEKAKILAVTSTAWGVPSDPAHDAQRRCPEIGIGCPSNGPKTPLLRNPTACSGPQTARAHASTWESPGRFVEAETQLPAITGCDKVKFEPSIEWRPTVTAADSPTGLHVDIHVPQDKDPEELSVADLRDIVITSNKGLVFNPAAATGLQACTPAQFGLHEEGSAHCPDASKVGTIEVNTPQLDHLVHGGIYMAAPHDNPFGSIFALYLAVDDPRTGVVVKLAGKIDLDPGDGQLTASFERNPQLPMEDFRLDFFGGPRAVLRTPTRCGRYVTDATLTPWSAPQSGPPATPSDSYEITSGPNGAPCPPNDAEAPNRPTFHAGTTNPNAGAYTPFSVQLQREDGSQQIADFTVSPPRGLTGRLAGIPYCPDEGVAAARRRSGAAEQADPSCPAASQVGTVLVAVGAGSAPFQAPGKVYLAGPFQGAPLSIVVMVPALAGPYDLGTVVVRTALFVEPDSGRLRVESERMPGILEGVPLDLRSISVSLDRPRFTLNPTNCAPMSAGGQATSVFGQTVDLSEPFQVVHCRRLGFSPHLRLRLLGDIHHGGHPSLRAMLEMPKRRGANISRVAVALPPSLFLDNEHIRGICTRPRFDALECPPNSIYAYAKASSPLLAKPLKGPVYMRTSNHELPDLVAVLNGQVRFAFGSEIGSALGGISANLDGLPDVPLRKFELTMRGGAAGLLQNATNACKEPQRARVEFEAQNGKLVVLHPPLSARCATERRNRR